MRTTHFTVLAAALALLLASCSNTERPKAPPVPTGNISAPAQVQSTPQPASEITVPGEAAPANAVAQLNPPHGEPGHRCDIPVGSPLDGSAPPPPAVNMPMSVDIPGASTAITPPPPSSSNSGMINPPHGEPGHDCAVPVGSPLP